MLNFFGGHASILCRVILPVCLDGLLHQWLTCFDNSCHCPSHCCSGCLITAVQAPLLKHRSSSTQRGGSEGYLLLDAPRQLLTASVVGQPDYQYLISASSEMLRGRVTPE
ncbi:hypothetical protein D3C81_917140 [compost metagenome]